MLASTLILKVVYMRLVEEGKNLLLTQIKDFDIKQTLECGQCFNFIELADKDYAILAQEEI